MDMAGEPAFGMLDHGFERALLRKKVARARHDHQRLLERRAKVRGNLPGHRHAAPRQGQDHRFTTSVVLKGCRKSSSGISPVPKAHCILAFFLLANNHSLSKAADRPLRQIKWGLYRLRVAILVQQGA